MITPGLTWKTFAFVVIAVSWSMGECGAQQPAVGERIGANDKQDLSPSGDGIAKIRQQPNDERMRVQDSIVKLAKLEAENEQLKKQQFANEKRIAELEAYTRESAPALKAAANTTNKLVETLTEQTTHMRDELKEIREILNRALPPKSGDKPPPASTKAASPAPKIESGVDPFSLPQQ